MTFAQTLENYSLTLVRTKTDTLQVNVGRRCDLSCRHCHQEAGPSRDEMMSSETVEQIIACAERMHFATIDITGGAPELLPHLPRLINGLRPHTPRLLIRTNLTALAEKGPEQLIHLYRDNRLTIVASLPSVNSAQTEAQRGNGVWESAIATLKLLNEAGFGVEGSGLKLDIAANPCGAFLPASQAETEQRFRRELKRRYGISFSSLFTFVNVPLGRFHRWLESSGNLPDYLKNLKTRFNPCSVLGLMCRSTLSVDWQGYLYDCDFNQAAGLYHCGVKCHISQLQQLPRAGMQIPTQDHCFACTAGAGFTCSGAIETECRTPEPLCLP